jgi:hypothetical protein
MANPSVDACVFPRGSGVLEYWLARCEGMTVQPPGARVLRVVSEPTGGVQGLVVQTRVTGRVKMIPADAVAAVAPWTDELLLANSRISIVDRRRLRTQVVTGGAVFRRVARQMSANARTGYGRIIVGLCAVGRRSRPHVARTSGALSVIARSTATKLGQGFCWLVPRVARRWRLTTERLRLMIAAIPCHAEALGCSGATRLRTGLVWLAPRATSAVRTGREHAAAWIDWLRPRAVACAHAAARSISAGRKRNEPHLGSLFETTESSIRGRLRSFTTRTLSFILTKIAAVGSATREQASAVAAAKAAYRTQRAATTRTRTDRGEPTASGREHIRH